PTLAGIEEALDLLVDASDDLHLPVLVHRAGDGERLLDREPRDRRQQRARLGDGSAVAFDAGVGLLEDEGRMDRQRRLLRVARAEIRRKDQHAFRMDRAAELDLALDVDDLAVADPHVGRDAGRLAELKAAQAEHRKAVDLTDLRARSVDQEIVALDFFLKLFAQTIDTPRLRVDGFLHVPALDDGCAFALCPEARLAHEVRDVAIPRREFLRIADQARRMLDHAGDRIGAQRQELVAAREGRDQPAVELGALAVAVDAVLEIGRDLEQIGEVRVELAEQVIRQPLADQHDLEVERHRLGLERDGRDEAQQLERRLDADLAGEERALQRGPRELLGQQAFRVEHQISAVRAMKRAWADHREVRDERAELSGVLDAADEIREARVLLVDDRRGSAVGVIDDDVDLVAPQALRG